MNKQQYFEMDMEMDTWRVVNTWTQDALPPKGIGVFNIGWPVLWHNPLWAGRTRGTDTAAPWAMISPDGNNEPKISVGLCSLSTPWNSFIWSTWMLTAKDTQIIVETWTRDAPPPYGKLWARQIRQAKKWPLQSLIHWGGGCWYQSRIYIILIRTSKQKNSQKSKVK